MFRIHLYLQCMGTTSVMLSAARRMRHSPRRNQLNHSYKLFARATKQSNPNTATDATSIGIQLILEGGVPQQPPEHDQPGINKEEQAQNRTERLETQKAKTPAEPFQRHGTGTLIGDPIDLGNLDAADFPIQNVQATNLKNNRAREMWSLQSRARHRMNRQTKSIMKWSGDPAESSADLAIVAIATINGKHQGVVLTPRKWLPA